MNLLILFLAVWLVLTDGRSAVWLIAIAGQGPPERVRISIGGVYCDRTDTNWHLWLTAGKWWIAHQLSESSVQVHTHIVHVHFPSIHLLHGQGLCNQLGKVKLSMEGFSESVDYLFYCPTLGGFTPIYSMKNWLSYRLTLSNWLLGNLLSGNTWILTLTCL